MNSTEITEMQAIEDLLTWEEEEDKLLPMEPAAIAELEARGFLVDLDTGTVSAEPDA